jgi:transmembrane sensor
MSKQHFRTLLKRYQANDCTPQERRLVEQWFALLDGDPPRRTALESQQLEDRMWQAIQQKSQKAPSPVRANVSVQKWWMAAAALVILGLSWFAFETFNTNSNTLSTDGKSDKFLSGLVQRTNTTNTNLEITLSDGSQVTLAPRSSLEYPAKFESSRREVNLKGEALFLVTRNSKQPFFVNAGEVTTKVLGTSFRIETGDNNRKVEVSVLTGKVSVFQRNSPDEPAQDRIKNGVILTPNQRVIYTQASRSFETSLVEQPMVVAPEDGHPSAIQPANVSFAFEDATMATVVEKLEKAYGIDIILENEELGKCLFTADLTEQPLFTKLDLLCASLNSTYEVRGTKILIMGNGCH